MRAAAGANATVCRYVLCRAALGYAGLRVKMRGRSALRYASWDCAGATVKEQASGLRGRLLVSPRCFVFLPSDSAGPLAACPLPRSAAKRSPRREHARASCGLLASALMSEGGLSRAPRWRAAGAASRSARASPAGDAWARGSLSWVGATRASACEGEGRNAGTCKRVRARRRICRDVQVRASEKAEMPGRASACEREG